MRDGPSLPLSPNIGKRSHRRAIVVVLFLGLALMWGIWWLGVLSPTPQPSWLNLLQILDVTVIAICTLVLYRRTTISLAIVADRLLDARQRQARDRAYRVAFQMLIGTLFLVGLVALIVTISGVSIVITGWSVWLLYTFPAFALAFPTAVIAWNEPDPDPAELDAWLAQYDERLTHRDEVVRLLLDGKDIEAIRRYREETGAPLREAALAIHRLRLKAQHRTI